MSTQIFIMTFAIGATYIIWRAINREKEETEKFKKIKNNISNGYVAHLPLQNFSINPNYRFEKRN